MKAILLDIEGTTTPIEFVHHVLFPFARNRMPGYVATNFESLASEIEQLIADHEKDLSYKDHFDRTSRKSVAKYLGFLISEDRKSTPLKSIQGKIWKEGYESGELKSVVFDDVPRAFERWEADGKAIAIFSSGSVLAQKLLFRYTDHGDLGPFITSYFDTNIGPKRDPKSYIAIAAQLDAEPGEILFVSDIVPELDAARIAGLAVALAVRPGNAPIETDVSYQVITTFDGLE
ncbi:MAG: acireductone synthase [Acidobacteria bacterium]|nr:MAG: acireductone synthase [Acidobacteriota bacterium]